MTKKLIPFGTAFNSIVSFVRIHDIGELLSIDLNIGDFYGIDPIGEF